MDTEKCKVLGISRLLRHMLGSGLELTTFTSVLNRLQLDLDIPRINLYNES